MPGAPTYGSGFLELTPELSSGGLSGFESSLSGGMKGVGKAAGLALVAGMTAVVAGAAASLVEAIGQEAGVDKAAARLGLSETDAARLGDIAGKAYMNNFGASMGDNQDVVAEVWRRFGDLGDEGLQTVTEGAQTLADVFDQDVVSIINAADQLLINGLAPDAETAMDIVASALQGAQGPVDEQLEALNEYSNHFAQIGFDAPNVLGALTSEWATNQYAIDKVGDAVKEFGIRVIDGSTLTKDSLAEIGFSVEEVEAAFAEGGPAAQTMSTDIINAILAIEDPAERARVGVGLMGTPFEDLGQNAVPILSDLVEGVEGFGGTTQDVADQAYDNISSRLSGAWRTLTQSFVDNVGDKLLPIADNVSKWVAEELPGAIDTAVSWVQTVLVPALQTVWGWITTYVVPAFQAIAGAIGNVVAWFQNLSPGMKRFIVSIGAAVAAGIGIFKVIAAFKSFVAFIKGAMAAFQLLKIAMLTNPFTAIAVAVVALATLIFMNWDKIKEFLGKAWDWIKRTASDLWDRVKKIFKGAIDFLVGLFLNFTPLGLIIKHFDKIKEVATGVKDWIVDRFNDVIDFFKKLPGRISDAVGDLFAGIRDAFKNAVNWVISKWNDFRLEIKLPSLLGGGTIGIDTPNIPLFHEGGIVPGRPGQEVLAMLEAGERVIAANEVADGGEMVIHNVMTLDGRKVHESFRRVERTYR